MKNELDLGDRSKGVSEERATLVSMLVGAKNELSNEIRPGVRIMTEGKARFPASWAQRRLWFFDRMEKASTAYHWHVALRLRGALEGDALQRALISVVQRHETLRTTFSTQGGEVMQEISPNASIDLQRDDLRELATAIREAQMRSLVRAELRTPFDLQTGPLVRARLIRLGDCEHLLLITMHHIISDGWSVGIIHQELSELYRGYVEGQGARLRPLAFQYADYVQWERQWLQGDRMERQLGYWKNALEGVTPCLELPTDRTRPGEQRYRGADVSMEIDGALAGRLKEFSERLGMSLFMTLLGGFGVLLSRLAGTEDVVIGATAANRQHPGVEKLVGFFVNMLPLRLRVSGEQTVQEYFEKVAEVAIGGYENQSMPFEKIVEAVQPRRSLAHHPLFQVGMAFQNTPSSELNLGGLEVAAEEVEDETAKFDLLLSLDERGGKIRAVLNYATDLFDADTARRWLDCFRLLLDQVVASDTASRIEDLTILSSAERRQVLEQFNPVQQYRQEQLLQELFEGQVRLHPQAIAVSCEGQSLTYGELNARANQLAWHLRDRGVGTDQLVGICVERSLEMVVGLLGILKAGGAYVPLDPSYPGERLAYMLADSAPAVVLTQQRLRGRLPSSDTKVIALDGDWSEIGHHASDDLPAERIGLRSDHLAYVIYTSGSTGKPKGAMNEHRAVVNRLLWMQEQYQLGEADRVLQKTPFSFDVSVWEFFWPLMTGARLVVARPGGHQDPAYLMDLIEESGVTTLHFVPSMLQAFLGQHEPGRCPSIRHIVCSGEELPAALQNKCLQLLPQTQLSNLYGPTECAVDVTSWECTRDETGGRVPIGRPIANTRIYVLDQRSQPIPIGVAGEIYIAGIQVGRGYLNRPELTAERFVPDRFSADPKARMYKTGDLGRWRSDGSVEYLGRNDAQVKIRGFRIELGEIEAQLVRHTEVKEAVVLAREDEPGQKRLVGYVIAKGGGTPSAESLREHLKGMLPEYMVPSAFVVLEAFPLSPNGKLDRRALPAPDQSAYTHREYEAPRGEVEEILAGIWQELLKVERVGRNDNFFELGGHSLLIVQMLERLRRVGLSAEVRRVFESPTLQDLAGSLMRGAVAEIEVPPNLIPEGCERITPQMLPLVELEQEQIDRIVQAVPGGAANIQDIYPLAPLQEGLLFHHLLDQHGADAYVVPFLLSVSSRERVNDMIEAIQATIDRHDILRTAVLWEQLPRSVQVVYRRAGLVVDETTLDPDVDPTKQIEGWMTPEQQRLDLRRAPLVRLKVSQAPRQDNWYALLQFHHVTCDHITMEILVGEVVARLNGHVLPVSYTVPYRNHVAQMLARTGQRDPAGFFRSKLGDVAEPTAPFGVLEVHGDGSQVQEALQEIEPDLCRRIRLQARRLSVSAATLFHAAWALVVASLSGRDDVVFATMLMGRLQGSLGVNQAMGMFINTLPLRLQLSDRSAQELIEQTQRELVELLAYEHASLAVARRCSSVPGSAPLFTALFNYRHNTPNPDAQWDAAAGVKMLHVHDRTNYPITISVDDLVVGFTLTAQADQGIDPHGVLRYLSRAIQSLVDALECSPVTPALSLEVLPEAERWQVIEGFNATAVDYPRNRSVHELFEQQVLQSPNSAAVTSAGVSLTYQQLNGQANRLAAHLRNSGMQPGEYVPILLPRSLPMLVAQIAVLKCGGAYIPLDPETPTQRLAFVLGNCCARRVLSTGALPPKWIPRSLEWIDCSATDHVTQPPESAASVQVNSLSPAYVMYTSGSTGTPKGVIVPHRAIARLVMNGGYASIRPTDCIPHCSNPAFDASTFEIWAALLNGARVLVVSQEVVLDARKLSRLLIEERATIVWMTIGLLKQYHETLAEAFVGLRYLMTGGDVVDPEIAGRILRCSPPKHLLNAYGPTECTTFSTTHRIGVADWEAASIPIGRPISNTTVYILDRRLRPLPVGVMGEIFIGGEGVASGYLNRPDLTAERFIPDPFAAHPEARMYKTGDLGRWRADGAIEFLGRNDEQVKIRGFRIELAEIETQLLRLEEVKQAVVLARQDASGEKRLVGYVVANEQCAAPSAEGLREHLKTLLPEYMVPNAFVLLEAFPLMSSGKLDRRALPAPDLSAYTRHEYEAPCGEVEEILAEIWQQLLKVERVGRSDNFFELGGHSLLAIKLTEAVRAALGCALPISAVFRYPCLLELAAVTSATRQNGMGASGAEADEYEEGDIPLDGRGSESSLVLTEALERS